MLILSKLHFGNFILTKSEINVWNHLITTNMVVVDHCGTVCQEIRRLAYALQHSEATNVDLVFRFVTWHTIRLYNRYFYCHTVVYDVTYLDSSQSPRHCSFVVNV